MFLVWKQGKIERIWQNIFTLVFTAFLLISVSWLFIDETSILSKWHDSCHPLCRWDCNTHLFLISNTILPILTLEILSVAKQKSKKRRLKRSLSLSFNWVEKLSGLDSEIELLIKKQIAPPHGNLSKVLVYCASIILWRYSHWGPSRGATFRIRFWHLWSSQIWSPGIWKVQKF